MKGRGLHLLGWCAKGVLALILLTLLIFGGAVFYLRTESGEAFLARMVEGALQDAGVEASIGRLEGPLPGRLRIIDLTLSDQGGAWLSVPSAELVLNWTALFDGRAEIESLRVESPEFLRLPAEDGEAPQTAAAEEPMDYQAPLLPDLPIAIRLNDISISAAQIGKDIALRPLSLTLKGALALEGGAISGALSLDGAQEEVGKFTLALDAAGVSDRPDQTRLALKLDALWDQAPTPDVIPLDVLPLLGEKTGLDAVILVPADLTPGALYAVESFVATGNVWSAKAQDLTAQPIVLSQQIEGLDLKGGLRLAISDFSALASLIDAPLQKAEAKADVALSLRMESARLELNGDAEGAGANGARSTATLRLTADGNWPEAEAPKISASLAANAAGVPWPSPELSTLLGEKITARLTIEGENGVYRLEGLDASGANLALSGAATLTFPTPPTANDLATDPLPFLEGAAIKAGVSARLTQFSSPDLTITNAKADLRLDGVGRALKAGLSASAPEMTIRADALSGLSLSADAALGGAPWSETLPPLSGSATAHMDSAMGSAFDLALSYKASPDRLELRELRAEGAGLTLQGQIEALLPKGDGPPLANGALALRIMDWKGLPHLAGLGVSGDPLSFDATLAHAGGRQNLDARIKAGKIAIRQSDPDMDDFSASNLDASLTLEDAYGAQKVSLSANSGAGFASGTPWRSASATAGGNRKEGRFSVSLAAPDAGFDGQWRLDLPLGRERTQPHEITLEDLRFSLPEKKLAIRQDGKMRISLGTGVAVSGASLSLGDGASLRGAFAIEDGKTTADIAIVKLPFALLAILSGATLPEGSLDLAASLKAAPGRADGTLSLESTAIIPGVRPRETASARLDARLAGGTLKGEGRAGLGAKSEKETAPDDLTLSFSIPIAVDGSGTPAPDEKRPVSAHAQWSGDIERLWRLTGVADRRLSGQGSFIASLAGTLRKPSPELQASIRNGRYVDRVDGVSLSAITLDAGADRNGRINVSLSATDGKKGDIDVTALIENMPLTGDGSDPSIALEGRINALSPLHRDDLAITLSGPFSVKGPLLTPRAEAEITVNQGTLRLLSSLGAGVRTLDVVEASKVADDSPVILERKEPQLALRIIIPNRFYIKGRGLESEWSGDLSIVGATSKPRLTGYLQPVRGEFNLLSKVFSISGGRVTFTGGSPPDPALSLEMTYKSSALTAIVRTQGTASRPKLVLDSQPSMPTDEIMSNVLFGKSSSGLSRFEALQVANSLRSLTGMGEGGVDFLGSVQSAIGVDVLRMGGSSSSNGSASVSRPETPSSGSESDDSSGMSGMSVEAGKYVLDNVYVGVQQGATPESTAVRVEVELLPNLTVDSRSSATSTDVGIGWKRDY